MHSARVPRSNLDPNFDRRSGVGASEVAALLGLDPRKTPLALWLEKTGQAKPFEGNAYTDMGHRFEPVIADAYAEREAVTLETCTTIRHPSRPHIFATPDRRVVGTRRFVELKAVFSPRVMTQFGEDGSADYPEHFAVQTMVQAAVCDAYDVHLAALIGADLRVYRVPRDHDRERRILDVVDEWWDRHIVAGVPPEMDGSDAADEWLRRIHPKHNGTTLEADEATAERVARAIALREDRDAAEKAYEVVKQDLIRSIADADGISAPGVGRVSYRRANGTLKTDWQAIALEAGAGDDLIQKHSRSTPGSRRFLLTAERSQ